MLYSGGYACKISPYRCRLLAEVPAECMSQISFEIPPCCEALGTWLTRA